MQLKYENIIDKEQIENSDLKIQLQKMNQFQNNNVEVRSKGTQTTII